MHNHDIQGHNRPKFGMERTQSIGSGFYHTTTQKSNIYANEISSVGIRQELKKNEKAHRELLEHIKKLGEYYND